MEVTKVVGLIILVNLYGVAAADLVSILWLMLNRGLNAHEVDQGKSRLMMHQKLNVRAADQERILVEIEDRSYTGLRQ